MATFIIKNTKDNQLMFVLKANNGKVVLSSENYTTRRACLRGIDSVRYNGTRRQRFERHPAENEQFYFVLKASNKKTIGKSQMYSSPSSAENGILSVMQSVKGATIVEVRTKVIKTLN